jgi:hypothetical protein
MRVTAMNGIGRAGNNLIQTAGKSAAAMARATAASSFLSLLVLHRAIVVFHRTILGLKAFVIHSSGFCNLNVKKIVP